MNNNFKVLTPSEYSGNYYGDFGYQINGVKSTNGYVSRKSAESAMYRKLEKIENQLKENGNK